MENRRAKIDFQNTNILPPNGENRVLLHCCCAPCTGEIIETLTHHGIDLTVFFYNPNIHPKSEYEKRKREIVNFSGKMNIPWFDADYDQEKWFRRVQGLEEEPERGQRCRVCFDMRLERAALFAWENGFKIFTSSFGVSRWKDRHQVNTSGMRAATRYPHLVYWTYNWRKLSGSKRMVEIAKEEQFYRQKYCGCVYSMRDTHPDQALQSESTDRVTQKS